jgi:uncharacterized damage-inducible protein DinB
MMILNQRGTLLTSKVICIAGLCVTGLLMTRGVWAQSDSPLASALVKHWETSKDLTLAVANAMPDDSYGFKATDAEMSFGEQMNHIAQADENYCSFAFGEKPSMQKPADNSKATAIKNLTAEFDFCIAGTKKMSDAELLKPVSMRGNKTSGFELLWGGFTHTAHHRGQAEVYLRLKGITPPAYKF